MYDKLRSRILPVPKSLSLTGGAPLRLNVGSAVCLSGTDHQKGPAATAMEQLTKALAAHCPLSDRGFPIRLSLGQAPEEVTLPEEGYRLTVTADAVEITGFGEVGLFYGVLTFLQLCRWEEAGLELPALEVLDWPESKYRGLLVESRYGSNLMERQDWFDMIDDLAEKKMNCAQIVIYGCWSVQFDGRISEYLYIPLRKHPQLQTPMTVKYFDPVKGEWIHKETLPPIFRDDLLGEIMAYGKERGVTVMPVWNSLGHNTLLPRMLPETSSIMEDGNPSEVCFCTNAEATYETLFSIYDQILNEYLIPNGIDCFHIGLDEVQPGRGRSAKDIYARRDPWCKCEKCRDMKDTEQFIRHTVRLIQYLADRGMKHIFLYWDMLMPSIRIQREPILDQFIKELDALGLRDRVVIDWWSYSSIPDMQDFQTTCPESGTRRILKPWTGYYIWGSLMNPLPNIRHLSQINHDEHGEGLVAYATYDRSYDRMHDALADYGWDHLQTGTEEDLTDRYVQRNFPSRYEEVRRAYKMVDYITESRAPEASAKQRILSNSGIYNTKLNYYYYSYVPKEGPYPRDFLGENLTWALSLRKDLERMLYSNAAMIRESIAIFRDAAQDPACNQSIARRMMLECENYLTMTENWLTILKIHDMTKTGKFADIPAVARKRQQAEKDYIAHSLQIKEAYANEAMSLRLHSICMEMFGGIAEYVEQKQPTELDLTNTPQMITERHRWLQ